MSDLNDFLNRAMELPEPDRAALARHLLASLEPEDFDPDDEAVWAKEIEARLDAIERGDFVASDWRESIARIRQSLGRGQAP